MGDCQFIEKSQKEWPSDKEEFEKLFEKYITWASGERRIIVDHNGHPRNIELKTLSHKVQERRKFLSDLLWNKFSEINCDKMSIPLRKFNGLQLFLFQDKNYVIFDYE